MSSEPPDLRPTDRTDGYERTVLTLRICKLVLGILVSTLTVLRLVGVV